MANVTVNITGGSDKENVTAATLGNQRWGANGSAQFGQALAVNGGGATLTIYKTTAPAQLTKPVEVPAGGSLTLNVLVNQNDMTVSQVVA
ncbi:hypothetical protein [Polaromonas sp. YR568]|uniref:hypothetical protein n=1 Tax=Polaromonas sp. YR568 TaxID=1855301 RepID=UPI00398C1BDF